MLFEKIVNEIAEYPDCVLRLHSVGEPILWDKLIAALKLAHDKSVKTWLFTCGVTRDKQLLHSICEYADIVEVSVNSSSPEDYRASKGLAAFNLVCENIEFLHQTIVENGYGTRLLVSRVETPTRSDDDAFIHHWKATGVVSDAFVRSYHTYNDLLPGISESEIEEKKGPCLVHWARLSLNLEGKAVVCFNELFRISTDPATELGDIREQTIHEIWHGTLLNTLRHAETTGNYAGPARNLPCRSCRYYQPLVPDRQTSEFQIEQLKNRNAQVI